MTKINLKFIGAKLEPIWRSQVERQLERVEAIASVSTADVALERRRETKPHFFLRVLLAVPGPDIHAEATEHTFQAVLLKVIRELVRQIKARKSNQRRGHQRQQLRNWPGALAGHRA
jgi:ribosome-associated translation inhibitor RaiA